MQRESDFLLVGKIVDWGEALKNGLNGSVVITQKTLTKKVGSSLTAVTTLGRSNTSKIPRYFLMKSGIF